MSRHQFSVIVDVDDEILAAHDGDQNPPPNEVDDWDFRDIIQAVEEGIVDEFESEVSFYDGLVETADS